MIITRGRGKELEAKGKKVDDFGSVRVLCLELREGGGGVDTRTKITKSLKGGRMGEPQTHRGPCNKGERVRGSASLL
jgi:hypothetical protein